MARRALGGGGVATGWLLAAAMGLALLAAGCQSQDRGPTTEDFDQKRAEIVAKMKKGGPPKARPAPAAASGEPAEAVAASFGSAGEGWRYEPEGKRDPFRSIEWEQKDRLAQESRGPLEQFDVNQLELAAVVWATGRARGLVEDPSGNSYIVEEGTPIGKNDGRVIQIDDDSLVVKETYVDLMGQKTTKDIEMQVSRN